MYDDVDNENGNFDSIPNISFDNNGQPFNGMGNSSFPSFGSGDNMHNGQFIPPMSLQLNENDNEQPMNNNINNSFGNNSNVNNNIDALEENHVSNGNGLVFYTCSECNSTFAVNGINASECILCHNKNISSSNQNSMNTQAFIPFKITRKKAIEFYKSKVMYNPVVPFIFKSKEMINAINKVYIPGYLYDTMTSGDVYLSGIDNVSGGQVKYDVVFNTSVEHNSVFYKNFSKINERVFNAVGNYNFDGMTSYDVNNLGQCCVLLNDVSKADIDTKMEDNCKKHVMALAKKRVKHQMKKVDSNNLNTHITKEANVLVPVYLLNVKYNNKDYMFIMNGENGIFSLDVPSGILEMLIFGTIIGLIIFGISVLVSVLF